MTEFLQQTGAAFFAVIAFLSLACCVILSIAYWRREKREKNRRDRWRADIADISILFQTMRDVIGQQKALAREFNEELDTKMSLVKQVLSTSLEKNERLYEQQQEVTRSIEQARAELESIQRQIAIAQSNLGQSPPTPTASASPEPPASTQEDSPQAYVSFDDETESELEADTQETDGLDGTGVTEAVYNKWEGIDFSVPEPEINPIENQEENQEEIFIPQAPEDAEAAREAFRALLDIDSHTETPAPLSPGISDTSTPMAPWDETAAPTPKASTGNGKDKRTAIRQRVTEYHQAGMSIPDIAHELGISKGEIRLILSLAKQQEI